jgi:hypothetical protein
MSLLVRDVMPINSVKGRNAYLEWLFDTALGHSKYKNLETK